MIRKILLSILAVTIFFLLLLEFFIFYNKGNFFIPFLTSKPTPIPSPSLSPLPLEHFIASPSAYANDETILKIEKDLVTLETDLDDVNLEEVPLHPPLLDLNVKY